MSCLDSCPLDKSAFKVTCTAWKYHARLPDRNFSCPTFFPTLWSEVYLFIVQVLALHLYDDPFSLAWLLALINKVVRVACESRSWFVLHTPEHIKQTSYATDQWHKWLPKQLQPCKREASAHRAFVPRFTLIFTKWNFIAFDSMLSWTKSLVWSLKIS